MTTTIERLSAADLIALARAARDEDCTCGFGSYRGWTSAAPHLWPDARLVKVGSLRDVEADEPSWLEHHPAGTRIDSPDAPIAINHFPANRADVYRCGECGQIVLHYQEAGGYYTEARVRLLDPTLVVDVPA